MPRSRSAPIKTSILTPIFDLTPKRRTERPSMAIPLLKYTYAYAAG